MTNCKKATWLLQIFTLLAGADENVAIRSRCTSHDKLRETMIPRAMTWHWIFFQELHACFRSLLFLVGADEKVAIRYILHMTWQTSRKHDIFTRTTCLLKIFTLLASANVSNSLSCKSHGRFRENIMPDTMAWRWIFSNSYMPALDLYPSRNCWKNVSNSLHKELIRYYTQT